LVEKPSSLSRKTLSREITRQFFLNEDDYSKLRDSWKILLENKEVTLAHSILYAVLRGRDWTKCFTPVSNLIKLVNGITANGSLNNALSQLRWSKRYEKDFNLEAGKLELVVSLINPEGGYNTP